MSPPFTPGCKQGNQNNPLTTPAPLTEHSKRGDLTKRVSCNEKPGTEAPVSAAVACINYLASLGQQKCTCENYKVFCSLGGAQLDGQSGVNVVTVPW